MPNIGNKIEEKLTKWLTKRLAKPVRKFDQSKLADKIRKNQKLKERVLHMDKKLNGWGQWTFYNRHKIENFHKWFVRIGAIIIFLLLVLFSLTGCGQKEFSFDGEWNLKSTEAADSNRNLETKFIEKDKKIESEYPSWNDYNYSFNSKTKELIIKKTDKLVYKVEIKSNEKIKLTLEQQGEDKKDSRFFIPETITLTRKE